MNGLCCLCAFRYSPWHCTVELCCKRNIHVYLFIYSLYRDLRIIPFVIVVVPNTLKNRQSFIGSVGFSEAELSHEKFMR